jgi:hypothetical protein
VKGFVQYYRKIRRLPWPQSPWLRKVAVGTAGGLLLVVGIAMIALPGPAVLVIPLGLTVLAVEFVWAKRWISRFLRFIKRFASFRGARVPGK